MATKKESTPTCGICKFHNAPDRCTLYQDDIAADTEACVNMEPKGTKKGDYNGDT